MLQRGTRTRWLSNIIGNSRFSDKNSICISPKQSNWTILNRYVNSYSIESLKSSSKNAFLESILKRFPSFDEPGCETSLSFAYGSGVFPQIGANSKQTKMLDFILVVNDPFKWHSANMKLNSNDYTILMRQLGPKFVANFQEHGGGRMYYQTNIPVDNARIKYGVISRKALICDLLDWDNLYVAGRLHKPVKIVGKPEAHKDVELHSALRINLSNAVHTALLTLPETFTEKMLYSRIASFSYKGDIRVSAMLEDNDKVENIVVPSIKLFRELYHKRLLKLERDQLLHISSERNITQDIGYRARLYHLTMLPRNLQDALVTVWNDDRYWRDKEDVLLAYANEIDEQDLLLLCLQHIVRGPSIIQVAKGFISTGIKKSLVYGASKATKSIASRYHASKKI